MASTVADELLSRLREWGVEQAVSSSLGLNLGVPQPDPAALTQAADLLNAGEKVASLVGQGARGFLKQGIKQKVQQYL